MCGLFAGIGKLSSNRMIALGSMNEERGTDSVGLAYVINNEMRVAKVAERPCVGLNITMRKEVTEAAVSGLFIGHTRAATQGTVTARNAHPFFDEGIAFAHNGIILNDEDFGKYEVDSESLIHGIKARDFSKYQGPVALLWIEDGKLKAYHCGNPLARGRHNGSVYLASEADYLTEIGCTHVKELSEGMIYTFDKDFKVNTERVPKNQPLTYVGKASHKDYGNTGYGWEDYQSRWDKKDKAGAEGPAKSAITTRLIEPDFPPRLSHAEREMIKQEEDFRTPRDIAKELSGTIDNCEMCGARAEVTEDGTCLECLIWLDDQGLDRDNPPAWLKGGC